ncbi:hypothetical protein ACEPAI_2441 [Sanghuangporus weigelae]
MDSDNMISATQLKSTFGSLFFSVVLGSALWGAASLQLYYYCEKFWETDHNYLKAYVVLLWSLDTIHQGLLIEFNYVYFVNGIADPTLLTYLPKEIGINGFIIGVIDAMVQFFFLRRVWCISNQNWKLTGILFALVMVQLVLTATYCVNLVKMSLMKELVRLTHFEIVMNSSAVFADIPLAISMIWLLKKNRSGVRRTDSIVNRLVRLTIGSGLVTALWAIVAVIGASASPHSLISLSADLIFPKLYFNCMMASLNARSNLRESLHSEVVGTSFGFGRPTSTLEERSNTMTDVLPKEQDMSPIAHECPVDIDLQPVHDERTV